MPGTAPLAITRGGGLQRAGQTPGRLVGRPYSHLDPSRHHSRYSSGERTRNLGVWRVSPTLSLPPFARPRRCSPGASFGVPGARPTRAHPTPGTPSDARLLSAPTATLRMRRMGSPPGLLDSSPESGGKLVDNCAECAQYADTRACILFQQRPLRGRSLGAAPGVPGGPLAGDDPGSPAEPLSSISGLTWDDPRQRVRKGLHAV